MKIYTYGIIDSNNGIETSLWGVYDSRVYTIPYREIGVAASNIYSDTKEIGTGIDPDHAVRHESVVEELMDRFTILPIRFLTVFKREDDILSMMKEHYSDFREDLDRLRNKVEYGIKVIWSGDTIKERIISRRIRDIHEASLPGGSPGLSFIKEKVERYKICEGINEEADKSIAYLDNYLSKFASEKKLAKLKTDNLLLIAYYLIDKEKQGDFIEAFELLKMAPVGLKYLFSGPWPPYNFITSTGKPESIRV